ncbi:MAG: phosphoenolpyruvate carboxykinase (ATP) [Gemmatimonadota bacterium]|nr:MAG: phosphoenolpyruvate carboxykinase (ATP) [Gemmatimonadota bacterium]
MSFDLSQHGITAKSVRRNPPPAELYEAAIRREADSRIAANGALVAYSGKKTGRSPMDKHLVKHVDSEGEVWWGPVNMPIEPELFALNRERARDLLNLCDPVFCIDGFAGWDPKYTIKVRIICSRPYHALFMHDMLIRPTPEELESFGRPDYVIYNAGQFPAAHETTGLSPTTVDLSFEDGEVVILGTEYAGEMKKGVFTIMNYLMPKQGVLSMHCSATADPVTGESSLLFGLSGTGKTTLSADRKRLLVGDDEHCWTDVGIFNIEGGCYAKTIDLSMEREPDIFQALRFGAVLENVVLDPLRHVDYSDDTITQNTRGAYPIDFIANAKIPCVAGHPTDIIFLTCDAFGVLPPVSRLTSAQAMYHFISGYTAKVAGTEVGVTDPQTTFSPCFGAPFLVWHPARYAEMLAGRIAKHSASVWLVNTGWTGGAHGIGSRIDLPHTRAIIDAIHGGELAAAPTRPDPVFGLEMLAEVPGVPSDILSPRDTWADKSAYDETARRLAELFRKNFEKYADHCDPEVRQAGPRPAAGMSGA